MSLLSLLVPLAEVERESIHGMGNWMMIVNRSARPVGNCPKCHSMSGQVYSRCTRTPLVVNPRTLLIGRHPLNRGGNNVPDRSGMLSHALHKQKSTAMKKRIDGRNNVRVQDNIDQIMFVLKRQELIAFRGWWRLVDHESPCDIHVGVMRCSTTVATAGDAPRCDQCSQRGQGMVVKRKALDLLVPAEPFPGTESWKRNIIER